MKPHAKTLPTDAEMQAVYREDLDNLAEQVRLKLADTAWKYRSLISKGDLYQIQEALGEYTRAKEEMRNAK